MSPGVRGHESEDVWTCVRGRMDVCTGTAWTGTACAGTGHGQYPYPSLHAKRPVAPSTAQCILHYYGRRPRHDLRLSDSGHARPVNTELVN